jgi:hypothetical protein
MNLVFTLLLTLSAQAQAPAYKGYAAVETTLQERMLTEGTHFSFLERYLQTSGALSLSPLLDLLGTHSGEQGNNEFRNGDPNAVNMLVWQMMLQLVAQDVASNCRSDGSLLLLNPYFQAALDPLCHWPAAEAKTDANLRGFWTAVMGYDAPESEFLAWEKFAQTSSVASQPAGQALPVLFFLIAYNPFFLLRQ